MKRKNASLLGNVLMGLGTSFRSLTCHNSLRMAQS